MRGTYQNKTTAKFISRASHELRTPLTIIKLQLQLLQRLDLQNKSSLKNEMQLPHIHQECLNQILKLEKTIQELLNLTKNSRHESKK
ncbi:MAG TPA: histidine kinase dimerization/phospho-acceptor domain-containing protein [Pseudobdellovibrionaceae bacterium]|nr:histidine kinase dimerization/phospho-acceptor domain-containing protein [Pseudobdellovibrionaceae bacterium]